MFLLAFLGTLFFFVGHSILRWKDDVEVPCPVSDLLPINVLLKMIIPPQ
jgi:hypothetical protein